MPSWSSSSRAPTNLVQADTNGNSDIFVRDRRPPQPQPSPTPTPTPRPVVKPAIIVAPNPVDFGSVPIGTLGVTQSATILSVGTGPVQVGAVAIGGPNPGDFLLSANPCTGTTLAPGASCALGVLFIGTATGTRTAQLSVASDAGPPEVVQLIAAVGVGLLRLDPPLGPPGFVTIATGEGFPANAPVTLTWSVGITPTPLAPVFTAATGAFTAQVLVLPGDVEGPRKLRAVVTLSGVPATPATAPFLVVAGTAVPPVSGLIQVFRDSLWACRSSCAGERAREGLAPSRGVGYASADKQPREASASGMICPKCGTQNAAGDAFCGGCGAFLEFAAEEAVAPDVAAVAQDAAQAPPGPAIALTLAGASTSSSLAAHPASAAIDGDPTTSWKTGTKSPSDQWLEVTFAPAAVTQIQLWNGWQRTQDIYSGNDRPRNVTIRFDNEIAIPLKLVDVEGSQRVDIPSQLGVVGVTRLRITIVDWYPATKTAAAGSPTTQAAISEIRLFGIPVTP
jgi:hypothetical protein